MSEPSEQIHPTLKALRAACGRGAAVQVRLASGPVWATLIEVRGARPPRIVVVVSVSGVAMEGCIDDVLALRE